MIRHSPIFIVMSLLQFLRLQLLCKFDLLKIKLAGFGDNFQNCQISCHIQPMNQIIQADHDSFQSKNR